MDKIGISKHDLRLRLKLFYQHLMLEKLSNRTILVHQIARLDDTYGRRKKVRHTGIHTEYENCYS
jgi:hypothetical protein